jgi:hypothetical protein
MSEQLLVYKCVSVQDKHQSTPSTTTFDQASNQYDSKRGGEVTYSPGFQGPAKSVILASVLSSEHEYIAHVNLPEERLYIHDQKQ